MTLKELIKSRYSVRSFTDEMVGIEKIKEILDIANSAPSGGNIQPWKVYVVTGNSKNKLTSKALHNFDNGVQVDFNFFDFDKFEEPNGGSISFTDHEGLGVSFLNK